MCEFFAFRTEGENFSKRIITGDEFHLHFTPEIKGASSEWRHVNSLRCDVLGDVKVPFLVATSDDISYIGNCQGYLRTLELFLYKNEKI